MKLGTEKNEAPSVTQMGQKKRKVSDGNKRKEKS